MAEKVDVIFIDPPMKKFDDDTFLYGNLYQPDSLKCKVFNPGLLSIASYVIEQGYSSVLTHIQSESEIVGKLSDLSTRFLPRIVAVSCNYMHTYLPSIEISHILRSLFPDAILVAGGQHIGYIPGFALEETSFDIIIQGEGEIALQKILQMATSGKICLSDIGNLYYKDAFAEKFGFIDSTKVERFPVANFSDDHTLFSYTNPHFLRSKHYEQLIPLDKIPFIRYDLYDNYLEYPPYLEESRGCYGKCRYCVSAIHNAFRKKSVNRFLDELERVVGIYGSDVVYPFTAANFGVNINNTTQICQGIIERFGSLRWISEFRLDLKWENYIDIMHESGCLVFAVGLESASEEILRIMNKTSNPEAYLQKAEKLISKIKSFSDAYTHLNLMFYAGESPESMAKNMNFISMHVHDISIVHYSPLIIYSNTDAWNQLPMFYKQYGSTIVKTEAYDKMHAYPVNSSELFSYKDGCCFSRLVEKMFVKHKGYMIAHETRVSRNNDGIVDEDSKQEYIQRMLKR